MDQQITRGSAVKEKHEQTPTRREDDDDRIS
jgi:hypothetical protein